MKKYLYFREHSSYILNNVIKFGSTKDIINRDTTYATGEYTRGYYIKVIEIFTNIDIKFIEKLCQNYYKSYNKYINGGTEFYNKIIINDIENYLNQMEIKYNILTEKNINNLQREYNLNILISKLKKYNCGQNLKKYKVNNFKLRDYQKPITTYIFNYLKKNLNIYLNLATGGGKTFIIFYILQLLSPDIIIIFSPRTKINEQNINNKYIKMLKDKYDIFNVSKDKHFNDFIKKNNKKIITCCIQSANKLYKKIKDYALNNIFIWFDEAHWAIDNWIKENINICWLDNNYKKIFTSASPDESFVKSNLKYFGKYYKPFTVKYLIKNKWLCKLLPYMYETNIQNINICKYILKHFKKYKKKYGFSFHSSCLNAFNLFYKHYKRYKKNKTLIKPFLLVSENKYIIENKQKINLNYNFMNINLFELHKNSIAYVVKQYDMGYDFSDLDFITFSDPKMSEKDIIQCIGRGTRPDKLDNGKNLEKKCHILLPIFISNENIDYNKIKIVLLYLIKECGIDFDTIIKNYTILKNDNNENNSNNYNGVNNIRSKLIDEFNKAISTTKRLYKICIKNNIDSEEKYNIFSKNNEYYKMKKTIYDYKDFKWKIIVDPNSEKYYNSVEECNKAMNMIIDNIKQLNTSKNKIQQRIKKLKIKGNILYHEYDNKIPPYNKLKEYYY
jgi:hypothetical protein